MKKISFAYLDEYEKILIKSMIKLLDQKKLFTVVENFDDDGCKKIVFINADDKKAQLLLEHEGDKHDFIAIYSPLKNLVNKEKLSSFTTIERVINAQKLSTALEPHQENKTVRWNEILNINKHCNFSLTDNYGNSAMLSDKNVYVQGNLFHWIERDEPFYIKKFCCDQHQGLTHYTYEGFIYLIHFFNTDTYIKEHTKIKMHSFPQLFPRIENSQDFKEFYLICFYLFKKEMTVNMISLNLNIHKDLVLRHINALYKMGFIHIEDNIVLLENKPSKVKSIFSKIKSVLGYK